MRDSVQVISVPWDSGYPRRRMGSGPLRLIEAGIVDGLGPNVSLAEYAADETFRGEVASAFDIQRWLAARVAASRQSDAFPLVLAGNCISSVGTCAGLRAQGRRVGVVWFDAHADFNTPETSSSGFLDGMALATLVGRCWTTLTATVPNFAPMHERSVLLVGARDLDPAESIALERSTVRRPRALNVPDCLESLDALRGQVDEVYVHLDLDVVDAGEARVNQYACAGGLTREQLVEVVSGIRRRFAIAALALTAYDPAFDPEARVPAIAASVVQAVLL